MLELIIADIKSQLSGLSWTDLIGGIVSPIKIVVAASDTKVEKTVPGETNNQTNCSPGEIIVYTPDTTKKSVLYFETDGEKIDNDENNFVTGSAEITAIAWINLKRINQNLKSADGIRRNLIANMPKEITGISGLNYCYIDITGWQKDPLIFSKYSFDEAMNQYLIYPFDYFSLNFTIRFRYNKSCFPDIALNPSLCQNY